MPMHKSDDRRKKEIIEAALQKWLAQCSPTPKEVNLVDEIAFEENYEQLFEQTQRLLKA